MLHIGLSVILQDVLASMRYHIWVCGGICVCTCGANILVMCICICIRTICKWYCTSGDTIYTIISGHVTPYLRSCGTISGGTYLCTYPDVCAVPWVHHAMVCIPLRRYDAMCGMDTISCSIGISSWYGYILHIGLSVILQDILASMGYHI